MTITTAVLDATDQTETVVYESGHGVPVKLHAVERYSHTEHRLEFGTGEGVIVLARRQDSLAMVRRHRPATGETFLELPRGMVGADETPELAAMKHLQRLTGHELYDPLAMGIHYVDNAIYPAAITTFYGVASNDQIDRPRDSSVESVEWWGLSKLRDMIRLGEIRDGHTLTALAHYMSRR